MNTNQFKQNYVSLLNIFNLFIGLIREMELMEQMQYNLIPAAQVKYHLSQKGYSRADTETELEMQDEGINGCEREKAELGRGTSQL